MRRNYGRWSSLGYVTLATVLSTATWSCKKSAALCGEGTVLNEQGVCVPVGGNIVCQQGERLNSTSNACERFDPCDGVNCADVPMPAGVSTLEASAQGTACICLPTQCNANYSLQAGACLPIVACDAGYRQEGNLCLPVEDVSCYDAPSSPLCIPTRCAEQPTASDGTDLAALGKCLEDPPPPPESCTNNCHNGIEDPHPWYGGPDLTCTGCHGGNAEATTRETAHVPIPAVWQAGSTQWGRPNLRYYGNYVSLFGVENFDGGVEWLRFRNPSDLRAADMSCGKNSGCHQDRVENVRRAVMATEPGLTGVATMRDAIPRSVIRGDDPVYKWDTTEAQTLGRPQIEALSYNPEYLGSVQRFNKAGGGVNRENYGAYDQIGILKEIYEKQCGDCHLGHAGFNRRYADFRTSGCGACHMSYALDGRSRSQDQMIKKDEPTYPAAYAQIANYNINNIDVQNLAGTWLGPERPHASYHRLTRQIASQRCGACHVGSNRTDWQYRGYQIDPNRTAFNALNGGFLNADQVQFTDEIDNNADANARYHGQAQNQVLKFVDWNNDGLDDIPTDIHYQAGLECMDCHTGNEMHNELQFVKVRKVTDWSDPSQVANMSGALWSHQDQATEVECVSCHGNLEYRALPYDADNRNPVKNLIACPEAGETIPDYPTPAECAQLGRGRWLLGKFDGQWHYVAQTYDTVANVGNGTGGGAIWPNGTPVYTLNASIFHGRYNADLLDGVGPCQNGNITTCYKDQANNQNPITQGFSHLGKKAVSANDQMAGGLECYSCHATWSNMCFGCHLRLADTNGAANLYTLSDDTGELSIGVMTEADFTYISPLDQQYGINSEGKISQFEPETKQHVAHTDRNNQQYFGTQVIVNNDANIQYNIYRDRAGYGTRQYNTEQVGLQVNADGQLYEQFAQMDNNAGQGHQQMMPHSVQRSHPLMDCNNCHLDTAQANAAAVSARWMANPNGFANVSAYLAVLQNTGITRNNSNQTVNVNAAAGFRFDANIDPTAFTVNEQSDWCVLYDGVDNGFPLCYNNHVIKQGGFGLQFDGQYARQYPTFEQTAGPLNGRLLTKMLTEVLVNNQGVQYRSGRR